MYIPTLIELKKDDPYNHPQPPVPHKTMVVHGAWHAALRQRHASPLQYCAPPFPQTVLLIRYCYCLARNMCWMFGKGPLALLFVRLRVLSETGPIVWTLPLQDPRYREG